MKKITRLLIFAAMFSVLAASMAHAGPGGKGEGDPEIPLGPALKAPAAQAQSNSSSFVRASTNAATLADSASREEANRWVKILKAYIRLTRVFSL